MTMVAKKISLIIIFVSLSLPGMGQDTWYGSTSGMRSMFNPAFSGAEGRRQLRLSSCSFLPGAGFGLGSVYAAADGFFPRLHGGASVWVTNDFMGEVMNDTRAGITYAYHLKAGDDLYFNAGLTASVINVGIRRSEIIFPDDLDPYGGMVSASGAGYHGSGFTRFDAGTGFTIASGQWYGGFAVMHLARPYMSDAIKEENRLDRKYIAEAGTTIAAGETALSPAMTVVVQGRWVMADAGISITRRQLTAGLSLWHIRDGVTVAEPTIGWTGNTMAFSLSYGYNIDIPDNTLPPAAVVRVSLNFIFSDVEKRRVFHVIKLPEM